MPLGETASEYWLYATEFLRHPLSTSCVAPTSWTITEDLASKVPKDATRILNLGPGSGRLERLLLQSEDFPKDGQILSIEKNPRFARFIRKYVDDPRLTLVEGSAEHLDAIVDEYLGSETEFDVAFCNIPLSIMQETRDGIMRAIVQRLKPGARFHVNIYKDVSPMLRKHFSHVMTNNHYGNFPRQKLHEAWNGPAKPGWVPHPPRRAKARAGV